MKKILFAFIFLASFTGFAEAQTSRNPCYSDKGQTTQGIPNCIGVGTSTPLPVTNSGTQTVSGAVTVGSYPTGATAITASATGTTAATIATMAAGGAGKTTYICGFSITSDAASGLAGNATVAGVVTGTMTYVQGVGVAPAVASLNQTFSPCIPASTTNATIVITSAAAGTGGATAVNAWGYQQ